MAEISSGALTPTVEELNRMHAPYRQGGEQRQMAPHIVYSEPTCPHIGCREPMPGDLISALTDHGRLLSTIPWCEGLVETTRIRLQPMSSLWRLGPLYHPIETRHHGRRGGPVSSTTGRLARSCDHPLNAFARFWKGVPPGELRPHPARTEPRPPKFGGPGFGRAKLLLSHDGLCRLGESLALPSSVTQVFGRAKLLLSRDGLCRLGESLALPSSVTQVFGRAKLLLSRDGFCRLGASPSRNDTRSFRLAYNRWASDRRSFLHCRRQIARTMRVPKTPE